MATFINNTWQAGDNEIACYVHVKELAGIKNILHIQNGVNGLLYFQGVFEKHLSEGNHPTDRWWARINRLGRNLDITFCLYKTEPFVIDLKLKAKTQELLDIDVVARVEISIVDAQAFQRFFMQQRNIVTVLDIKSQLISTTKPVVQTYLRDKSIDSLLENQDASMDSVGSRFLEEGLSETLLQKGLQVENCYVKGISHDELNEINKLKAQHWIANRQSEVQLEEKEKQQKLYQESELVKLKEDAIKRELRSKQYDQEAKDSLQEINQLEKILEARNKAEAIKAGADKSLWLIQQDLQKAKRENEQTDLDWELFQQQAKLRRDKKLKEAKIQCEIELKEKQVEQERQSKEHHDSLLHEARVRELKNEVELAALIDDETERLSKRENIQKKIQSEFDWAQGKAHLQANIENEKLALEQQLWKTDVENTIAENKSASKAKISGIELKTQRDEGIQRIELEDKEANLKIQRFEKGPLKWDQLIERQEHQHTIELIKELKDVPKSSIKAIKKFMD